jgi:hypothetical protein
MECSVNGSLPWTILKSMFGFLFSTAYRAALRLRPANMYRGTSAPSIHRPDCKRWPQLYLHSPYDFVPWESHFFVLFIKTIKKWHYKQNVNMFRAHNGPNYIMYGKELVHPELHAMLRDENYIRLNLYVFLCAPEHRVWTESVLCNKYVQFCTTLISPHMWHRQRGDSMSWLDIG